MKYLKEYNDHSKQFCKIDQNEFLDYVKKTLSFTTSEYNTIKSINDSAELYNSINKMDNFNRISLSIYKYDMYKSVRTKRITLYKTEDEWYYISCNISSSLSFYRCDQMTGVLDCIEYIKNNI